MFKDTSEGRTYYHNDGCGMPEHNDMTNIKIEEKVDKFDEFCPPLKIVDEAGNIIPVPIDYPRNKFKVFFRQALTEIAEEARKAERKKIVERVGRLKKGKDSEAEMILEDETIVKWGLHSDMVVGYNQALDDLIAEINK